MSDTSPSEMAEILADKEKRDRWIVFTLLEIKTDIKDTKKELRDHVSDDKSKFSEISDWKNGLSQSVGGLKIAKARLEGGWSKIVVIAALLVFLVDVIFKIAEFMK